MNSTPASSNPLDFNHPILRLVILLLFSGFLVWDLYDSFEFYRHTVIMGDLTAITSPVPGYDTVLKDPLGINVLLTGEAGAGPNRFWAHFLTCTYFDHVPLLLQQLGVPPIDSLYASCALLKLIVQIGLMLVLSKWALGKQSLWSIKGLVMIAFVGSFFLTADTVHRAFDVKRSMTIIDNSIVYTIFYACSLLLLMLYLHPFLQRIRGFKAPTFSIGQHLVLLALSIVVSFNGSLNSPVLLLLCPILLLVEWSKHYLQQPSSTAFFKRTSTALQSIPKGILFHFIWIILLNLYSFYLGTFNVENPTNIPTLAERYSLFWDGFYHEYIWNDYHPAPIGIILVLSLINTGFLLPLLEKAQRNAYLNTLALVLIFIMIYTLLLPLGGYRSYRPLIVRYDVGMPTTVSILFLLFRSSSLLLQQLKGKIQLFYGALLLGLMIFLSIIDRIPNPPSNGCEYACLEQLVESEEQLVVVHHCPVLSWHVFGSTDGSESIHAVTVLHRWGILDDPNKRFYNQH